MTPSRPPLGATLISNNRCSFCLWAPNASRVDVMLDAGKRIEPLTRHPDGYHVATLGGVELGSSYMFRLDGKLDRPDPASRLQSDGVHGPSRIVDLAHDWQDINWRGKPLREYVIYELHVGTFSRSGTFAGIIPELRRLRELGVTAIELMPIAQFPGDRNWGYDGVYPFAVQSSYGGPNGLQRFVDECHRVGLAVILDVVYNHLGPEGNYLADFGPYFTDRYRTPWGQALNFDGEQSEGVRQYFVQNALMWLDDFHIDALRLDAVHAIVDRSALPFLEELADTVHRSARDRGRNSFLIGESDLNDPRLVRSSDLGGHGLDAMWCDDYHHAAHVLISGEEAGYYSDYGRVEDLAQAFRCSMSNPGGYSEFRKRRHGRPASDLRSDQCVVCVQNHDQIGNRLLGERLSTIAGFEQQKLAAGVVCLSPFLPMLFMGEEYGETAPFQYFVSHSDEALLEGIRRGRRDEFASFGWADRAPDPGALATFERCQLNTELHLTGRHAVLHRLYSTLLHLRRRLGRVEHPDECTSFEARQVLLVQRPGRAWMVFCFSAQRQKLALPIPPGAWELLVSSSDISWEGPGASFPERIESKGEMEVLLQPFSFVCFAPQEIEGPYTK